MSERRRRDLLLIFRETTMYLLLRLPNRFWISSKRGGITNKLMGLNPGEKTGWTGGLVVKTLIISKVAGFFIA